MLKQEINYKDLELDIEKVKLNNYLITENYSNKGYEKVVTCFVDNIEDFSVNMTLKCMISVDGYDSNGKRCVHPYQYEPQIRSIDLLNKSFSFNIVTYISLPLMYVDEYNDINENKVWEFNFLQPHLYTPKEKGSIKIIYNDYDFLNGSNICELIDGEYIDDNTLKFNFNSKIEHIIDAGNQLFDNNYYNEVEKPDGITWVDDVNSFDIKPYDVYYSSPEYIRVGMNEGDYIYYQKVLGASNINNIICLRDNILLNDINNFELYYNKLKTCINIPLSQTFETNLHKQEILEDAFVRNEIGNSVNSYIDMEKHVYHPVLVDRKKLQDDSYKDVTKINFNLHFLERKGEDWIVSEDSYWNGVIPETLSLKNYSTSSRYTFFSYKNKPEYQSDLLKFLNFKTDDVRYQREKLKRSFLRLSFYDSRDQNNQNLLGYSTIFMDSGKLFSKLMRHVDDQPYVPVVDKNTTGFITGININVEPTGELITNTEGDLEKLEDYRLSTQFSVKDRNNSLSSSEGFYMYLWADNDAVNIPNDIYMKVEFNHAGYGRTIPFMMPFFDKENETKGIKKFNDILNDWKRGGYSIKRYLKYSYIHFKYKYDNDSNRHIYYLDPDTYGQNSFYNDSSKHKDLLSLNLYEGKFNFNNEDETDNDTEGKLPINEDIYDLKIDIFKWENSDSKIVNFNPCGGSKKIDIEYSYKYVKTYKTYDECYLYFPNKENDTYGNYKYVRFNSRKNKYEDIKEFDPSYKEPIENVVTIDVKPSDYTGTKHPYVRYDNTLYYYDNGYKYYYKYIENRVNEPIISIENTGGEIVYSLNSNFNKKFEINKETNEVKAYESKFPFTILASIKAKVKFVKNNEEISTEDMEETEALKMYVKTCDDFEKENGQIKKYFTIRTDLQSFDVKKVINNEKIKIENYPNIDPAVIFSKEQIIKNNMIHEQIETTFSCLFKENENSFKVNIFKNNNNLVNYKTVGIINNGGKDEINEKNFYSYDLLANKETVFKLPKTLEMSSYRPKSSLVLDEPIMGYDTISESIEHPVDFLYLEKNTNQIEKIIVSRLDIFNIVFLKSKKTVNSFNEIEIVREVDNNSEIWAKIVKNKNDYELHVLPNYGMYRECILLFHAKDVNNNIYNITKVITQSGSGNCILHIEINNDTKRYEHVRLYRTYIKDGKEESETYGEEFENGRDYYFVEGSTISIKAETDVDSVIDENNEVKTVKFKNFKLGNTETTNNVITLTMDINKKLIVNFGE